MFFTTWNKTMCYQATFKWLHSLLEVKLMFQPITTLGKKATINQVTTTLATSKNVLFPGHNHHANCRCWWSDTLIFTLAGAQVIIKVSGHQHWGLAQWLWPGSRTFFEVASIHVWSIPGGKCFFAQCNDSLLWVSRLVSALTKSQLLTRRTGWEERWNEMGNLQRTQSVLYLISVWYTLLREKLQP